MDAGHPACFGKLWDEKEPDCAGGKDPTHSSGARERCSLFKACGEVQRWENVILLRRKGTEG
jgi:hypothetical protein